MRQLTIISLLFLEIIGLTTLTHGAGVMWQDNFESQGGSLVSGSAVTHTWAANPSGSGSAILLRDLGTTSNWGGEVNPPNGRIFEFSDYGAVAGVDKVLYSYDIFIPQSTVAVGDRLYFFSRILTATGVDSSGATEIYGITEISTLAKDRWHTITGEAALPVTTKNNGAGGGTGPAVRIAAFLSYNDNGTLNATGDLVYLDNIQFYMTPEPSKMLLLALGLVGCFWKRRR